MLSVQRRDVLGRFCISARWMLSVFVWCLVTLPMVGGKDDAEGACDENEIAGPWEDWAVWGIMEAMVVAVDWTQHGRKVSVQLLE